MKTCSQCGELNGDPAEKCFKCGHVFGKYEGFKKICPKCYRIFSGKTDECEYCHVPLTLYTSASDINSKGDSTSENYAWLYIVSFLIPILGFILGAVYISKGKESAGKAAIFTGIASMIICSVLWAVAVNHML